MPIIFPDVFEIAEVSTVDESLRGTNCMFAYGRIVQPRAFIRFVRYGFANYISFYNRGVMLNLVEMFLPSNSFQMHITVRARIKLYIHTYTRLAIINTRGKTKAQVCVELVCSKYYNLVHTHTSKRSEDWRLQNRSFMSWMKWKKNWLAARHWHVK